VELWAVASTRRLCENARQIQAANWRAASSFPLVNYLPVAPVHEPGCQLVNHVALVQLGSVDTEPMGACNALTARVRVSGARRVRAVIFCEGLRVCASTTVRWSATRRCQRSSTARPMIG
jgi:hypothetical protein